MFAVLGTIEFDVLTSPTSFESEQPFEFAVHKVVEARPLLQWIGTGLREVSLTVRFHSSFTNPATQLQILQAAAEGHSALALVLGNGRHLGYFVIASIGITQEQTADDGSPISITVKLKLQEWVLAAEISPTKPPKPTFTPLALAPAPQTPALSLGTSSSLGTLPAASFEPPTLTTTGSSALLGNLPSTTPVTPASFSSVPPQQIVGAP